MAKRKVSIKQKTHRNKFKKAAKSCSGKSGFKKCMKRKLKK